MKTEANIILCLSTKNFWNQTCSLLCAKWYWGYEKNSIATCSRNHFLLEDKTVNQLSIHACNLINKACFKTLALLCPPSQNSNHSPISTLLCFARFALKSAHLRSMDRSSNFYFWNTTETMKVMASLSEVVQET